jgi:glycosyltransferase involved in cell wall biosynthesis
VKHSRICMVAMFPPPLHGMSLINDYVRKCIAESEAPYVIDYSPRRLSRSLSVRSGKLFRVMRCFVRFALLMITGQIRCVYFGLSGGNGQMYDALFVGLSRLFGKKLYLHHHSYQYLNRIRWPAKLLMAIAGVKAIHIVACEKMAADLKHLYPVVMQTQIISGIAALEFWDSEVRQRTKIQAIGFLSNITVAKGVIEFLAVAEWADRIKLPIWFVLAGPYQDNAVRQLVEKRMAVLSNLSYLGPVYGNDKLAYFDSIDVFLFPTKYDNESEGLVIHEAMSRGVPVISYSRGCIEQIISDQVGLRLTPSDDFVEKASKRIQEWLTNPSAYLVVSQNALKQFQQARAQHGRNIERLSAELLEN